MDEDDFKIHQCSSLPKEGIEVIFSRNGIDGYDSVWNLIIRRESTEEDLEENHHLEAKQSQTIQTPTLIQVRQETFQLTSKHRANFQFGKKNTEAKTNEGITQISGMPKSQRI